MSDNKYHSFHGINRNGNVGTLLYVHGNDNAQFCGNESCYTIADLTENFIKGNLSFDDSLEIVKKKKLLMHLTLLCRLCFRIEMGVFSLLNRGLGIAWKKKIFLNNKLLHSKTRID